MPPRTVKLLFLVGASLLAAGNALAPPEAEIVDVRMIWGRAPHNASTDLMRFRERWYCVFREARLAAAPDGAVRVLSSADGNVWQPSGLVSLPGADLRDPKLSTTSYGRLLLLADAVSDGAAGPAQRTLAWSSPDSREWEGPVQAADPGMRLGHVTWHLNRAYSVGYGSPGAGPVRLYSSGDGERFTVLADNLLPPRQNAEAGLLFGRDGSALCLMRGDGAGSPAQLGKSRAPYRAWSWSGLNAAVGAPNMLELADGRVIVAGSIPGNDARIALWWLDPERGTLKEFLRLPSGGDSERPGLASQEGMLWVAYHSSHEGRAMIYLARIKLLSGTERKQPTNGLTLGK
jgi:hypothetical protein